MSGNTARSWFSPLALAAWAGLGPLPPFSPAAEIPALAAEGEALRVTLDGRVSDPRDPGPGDFLDCPKPAGPCRAGLVARVEPDEKVILPRNKPREELKFLSLKGYHTQGRDQITTLALFASAKGESLFVDFDNDEDLGNDRRSWLWRKGDSCVSVDPPERGLSPFSLCRGPGGKDWKSRCDSLKSSLAWADCGEGPYRLEVRDVAQGMLGQGSKARRIGLFDADGDGKYRYMSGDRLLVDWNGDGMLEKSLEGDGFALAGPESPLVFSLESVTYRLTGIDENGAGLDLRRLRSYDPAARLYKPVEGKPAPDLRFINLDGDTMNLSDFRGKKVLVNFWSTLCKPCLEEFPDIKRFQAAFGKKNWQVISLTTDRELDAVQQASLKYDMDWMVGMVGPEARFYYSSHGLPMTVKINADGVLEKKRLAVGKRPF